MNAPDEHWTQAPWLIEARASLKAKLTRPQKPEPSYDTPRPPLWTDLMGGALSLAAVLSLVLTTFGG